MKATLNSDGTVTVMIPMSDGRPPERADVSIDELGITIKRSRHKDLGISYDKLINFLDGQLELILQ